MVLLRSLGFSDTEGDAPGHRIFTHERLSRDADFISFSIDCGHRPSRDMKLPYVVKTISLLRKFEELLEKLEE